MKDELRNYMGRAKRYDNIDGTGEMLLGVMLLVFALLGYLQAVLPNGSMWRNGFASMLFMYAVLVPGLALGYWGRNAIKKHITWPRTGYVAFSHGGRSWWKAIVTTFIVGGVAAAGFECVLMIARRHEWACWSPGCRGMLTGSTAWARGTRGNGWCCCSWRWGFW
jgi:hypothetical protein